MKTALTIIIFIIFGFMYAEIENMIEAKSNDLTNLFLWFSVLIACFLAYPLLSTNKKKLIRTHYNKTEEILTLTYSDGTIKQYSGDCTVWYSLPNFKRCGTLKEYELTQYWEYHRKTDK